MKQLNKKNFKGFSMIYKKVSLLSLLIFFSSFAAVEISKKKVAIVISNYHPQITSRLLQGAMNCLHKNNIADANITIAYVPGSYEIPLTAQLIAQTKKYDAIICLGAISSAYNHANILSEHVVRGIYEVNMKYNLPVTWGILLFDELEDALKSSEPAEGSRGWEAANAALEMVNLIEQMRTILALA
jgi:6,7-dimethyl-8-ribityllumazine synthase